METRFLKLPPRLPSLSPPKDLPEGFGNCGIFGVALLCSIPHSRAAAALLHARRDENPRSKKFGSGSWQGGTTVQQRLRAIHNLGFLSETSHPYCPISSLVKDKIRWSTPQLLRIRRHVLVLHEGFLYDQSHPQGIIAHKHPDFRKEVTHTTWLPPQPRPASLSVSFLSKIKEKKDAPNPAL